jgi:hypothetical protein
MTNTIQQQLEIVKEQMKNRLEEKTILKKNQ